VQFQVVACCGWNEFFTLLESDAYNENAC